MLYREIIAVCSQIHTKHINTLCGQNVELLNVKLGFIWLRWNNMYYNTTYLCAVCGESWEGYRRDGWLGTTGRLSDTSGDIGSESSGCHFAVICVIACSLAHFAIFVVQTA